MRLSLAGLALSCALGWFAPQAIAQAPAVLGDVEESLIAAPTEGCFAGCGEACSDCYDCCDCFNGRQRFLGLLPSDHCFDSFVSPLSNPFYFEDPRSLTEVRGIFIENALPSVIDGGDLQIYAAQLRGRVTDRVSIIAPRLGYLNVNQAGDAPQGFMSAPIGFKYNFYRDVERQILASAGITYFIKGSGIAGSNFGDGSMNFYLSAGAQIFDHGHWITGTGFRIPMNNNWGTQFWYWSNQWDYELPNHIYPLIGINWFHWMSSAGIPLGSEVTGLDLIDVPAVGVAGTNVVTCMAGVKWKPTSHFELGSGFEFPLTDRSDILKNRLYVDMIFRY
ncbi:MAG: hypothetical protein DWQ37_18595 [Planctomycetota bacterium]|nr:MAG: hypothetical protein DWQ37_18595 [Planctomycetota bacterium]